MSKARFLFTLVWLFAGFAAFAQSVRLDYDKEPLNDILLDLNDRYQVQISIAPKIANQCLISIHTTFPDMDQAMEELANRCELSFVKIEGIYTFFASENPGPSNVPTKRPKPQYLYQGTIMEKGSLESIPFALMQFGERGIVADENGRFSFKSTNQTEKGLFRSLGYQLADTVLSPGTELNVLLKPALMELGQIEVIAYGGVAVTHTGDQAGHLRFNDISNNLVPGLSDNLIFNNLRLYPGIMAAGEAITDFVIWGSYSGQNYVSYDGITLFNSWGINDDMGRINPYMIRSVEVYKGGFNVPYGDRIGGSVIMEGTDGNMLKPELRASFTNQLANLYVNVPVGKTSLQVAGRKTLFDAFDLSSDFEQDADLIVPTYDYTDLNLKLTSSLGENGRLELSAIYSEDEYQGNLQFDRRRNIIDDLQLSSKQTGSSGQYTRSWAKGGISQLQTAYSRYQPTTTANLLFNPDQRSIGDTLQNYAWTNPIEEFRASITHTFAANQKHQLKANLSVINNQADLEAKTEVRVIENSNDQLTRWSMYLMDDIQFTPDFSLQLGLKADLPQTGDAYWQPRINARWDISKRWNVHMGWGIYNQFVARNSVVDEIGNRSEVWRIADGEKVPVPKSVHSVLGLGYQYNDLELGIEGFHKNTSGFGRFSFNRNGSSVFNELEATTLGMELFARKKLGVHEFWTSYTLMEVEEQRADAFFNNLTRLAPQSQKHELKAVAVLKFNPVQVSLSTVYGSGFPNRSARPNEAQFEPYRRTDLAVQYAFGLSKVDLEAGLSILNLFNQQNLRLNQTINSPSGGLINTVGIPFTPTIYVNLGF